MGGTQLSFFTINADVCLGNNHICGKAHALVVSPYAFRFLEFLVVTYHKI